MRSVWFRLILLVSGSFLGAACSSDPDSPLVDGGPPDGARSDAPVSDAALLDAVSLDAASLDAAPLDAASLDAAPLDAASVDAASVDAASLDAASLDAAPLDAQVDAPPPCTLPTLLDDPFADADLASGGTNGGFVLRGNGLHGNSTVSELSGVARVLTATDGPGGDPNIGPGSISSFDASAAAVYGLTIRWEISHADVPVWQGIGLYLTQDSLFYENNTGLTLRITGNPGDDFGNYGVGLNAISGGTHAYDAQTYDMAALADGFTAVLEVWDVGWAFRIDGLKSDASPIAASGTWTTDFAFADLFDADVHVGAAIQGRNTDTTARQLDVERITVLQGRCPAGVEPTLP